MTSPGDDQSSGTMKLFPDLGLCICESMNKISLLVLFWYQEFARSDWMGLSGGDQSCQNHFQTCQNNFCTSQNNFSTHQNNFPNSEIISNEASCTLARKLRSCDDKWLRSLPDYANVIDIFVQICPSRVYFSTSGTKKAFCTQRQPLCIVKFVKTKRSFSTTKILK